MITENGFYLLVNTKKSEIVAVSDEYDLLIKFMLNHGYICKSCVVRQVKKKVFEDALVKYEDFYLHEIEGIAIRQKDVGTFMRLKEEEVTSLVSTVLGLKRISDWGSIKKKEKEAINSAINVIFKYIDDDEKMLKKTGMKSMCSDIEYLEGLQELDYRR